MELLPGEIDIINSHVGDMTPEALENVFRNIDYYIHERLSVFVPLYNYCHYAVLPDHYHNSYSFILYVDNNSDSNLKVEGEDVVIPKSKGCVCVSFSPGIRHQEIIKEGFSSYYAVFVKKEPFEFVYKWYNTEIPVLKGEIFNIDSQLLLSVKQFMNESKLTMPGKEEMIKLITDGIIHQIVRGLECNMQHDTPFVERDDINKAVIYIYKNISNKISVEELAYQANLSVPQFNRVFKQLLYQTPNEYIRYVRIERAKILLKEGKVDLTSIALECGFSSSSYFSHCFIESEGLTPKLYREKYQV